MRVRCGGDWRSRPRCAWRPRSEALRSGRAPHIRSLPPVRREYTVAWAVEEPVALLGPGFGSRPATSGPGWLPGCGRTGRRRSGRSGAWRSGRPAWSRTRRRRGRRRLSGRTGCRRRQTPAAGFQVLGVVGLADPGVAVGGWDGGLDDSLRSQDSF